MNPYDMVKNLQAMQEKMREAQERIRTVRVEGTSGGDMVKVVMDGAFNMLGLTILPEANDPDDPRVLADLVLAAFTDAHRKVKEKIESEISSATGGVSNIGSFLGL